MYVCTVLCTSTSTCIYIPYKPHFYVCVFSFLFFLSSCFLRLYMQPVGVYMHVLKLYKIYVSMYVQYEYNIVQYSTYMILIYSMYIFYSISEWQLVFWQSSSIIMQNPPSSPSPGSDLGNMHASHYVFPPARPPPTSYFFSFFFFFFYTHCSFISFHIEWILEIFFSFIKKNLNNNNNNNGMLFSTCKSK